MGYKALVQIALIVLALILFFMYIKPTFGEIGEVQDEIFEVKNAAARVEEFNNRLSELVRAERSFSERDRQALDLFLPSQLDVAQVMRDIEVMFEDSGVVVESLSAGESTEPNQNQNQDILLEGEGTVEAPQLQHQDLTMTISGDYEAAKNMLAYIEANAYPLEVVTMQLATDQSSDEEEENSGATTDEDNLSYELVLRVHAMSLVNNE